MKLSAPQQTVAQHPARFKVVCAGRRFGKTFLSIREICYRARIPNREVFYITTSYRAAKMIVWKPLKRRLLDLRWVKKINESELSILLKNGTTIALKGAEDPDRLRGVSLDYVVIDEAASCKLENLWGEIVRPALADRQGQAMFIGTPQGKSNAFYDLYTFASDLNNTDWSSWQFTTLEGGFVTEEEIQAAKQDMTERQFNQEFLATFESYENRVAWAFDRDTHVIDTPKNLDTSTVYIGMDHNVNPMTACIATRSGDTLTVIDELHVYSSNTQEIADEINSRYPRSKIFVYPDPAGAQRKTSAGGATDHSILANAGFVVKAPRRHDPVRDRINATNARFRNATGEINLYICKDNKYTVESLDKHTFKEGTGIPDKDTGYDHQFDALSYMVSYLFPITRSANHTKQNKWGAVY
jgi:phage terminase large subunit